MIVLDTNALVWLVSNPEKLSQKARKRIDAEVKKKNIFISSMSVWEICLLVKKDRLSLSLDLDTWLEKIEQLDFLNFVPVDNRIAARSVALPDAVGRDPADRIIVATAREYGAVLVTSDAHLLKSKGLQTLW